MQEYGKRDRQKELGIKRGVLSFLSPIESKLTGGEQVLSSSEHFSVHSLSLSHTHCLVSFSSRRCLGLVSHQPEPASTVNIII